jgi:hypothetical protein
MPTKMEKLLQELDSANEQLGNEFDKTERVEKILPMLKHPYAGKHATLPIAFHECTSSIKRLSKDREHSLDTMHSVAELLNTLHSLLSDALLDRERYDPSSSNCDEDDDDDDDDGKET